MVMSTVAEIEHALQALPLAEARKVAGWFRCFLNDHGRYGEAAQAWQKITDLTPDNVWGYLNVGAAYFNFGEFEKAAESFRRGLQIAPDNADLYSNAGTVSFFLGRFGEDVTYCQRAIELRPQKYDYWGNLADGYRMIPGESSKAQEAYRKQSALRNCS